MVSSLQSEELRRHVRVDWERRAWCEHHDWTLYLPIANLSHGGLFLQTSTVFARGERLRVCITDSAPGIITLNVEVVWSSARGRTVGVGCRIANFVEGAESYAQLVDRLMANSR